MLVTDPRLDWMFRATPDPKLDGRQLLWYAGRMTGGGSSIKGMVSFRGRRDDYDDWAVMGCIGWSWADVEPSFRCVEGYTAPRNGPLGQSGPLPVSPMRSVHQLAHDVVRAAGAIGYLLLGDHNSGEGEGAYYGSGVRPMATESARRAGI